MADVLTFTDINQQAINYQQQLRMLPYLLMEQELANIGVSLLQVAGKDVRTEAQRRGGLLRPYDPANLDYSDNLLSFKERILDPQKSVISMKDSISNYSTKKLLNNPKAASGVNQTKKHPFEDLIVSQTVKTATEDVLDALFSSEYNIAVRNPQGSFDGLDTKIDNYVVSTEISAANKNYFVHGVNQIAAPVDATDTIAIDQAVLFVRFANLHLKRKGLLYMTPNVYQYLIDALENKNKYKSADLTAVESYINQKSGASIKIVVTPFMGTGNRLILTIPGNFEFGMDTFSDPYFVQVRNPYEDPNLVQFWLQADFGTRINSLHPKEFLVNDGTPAANALSGDYTV